MAQIVWCTTALGSLSTLDWNECVQHPESSRVSTAYAAPWRP